jgi:predicted dehydrogenase
MEQAGETDVRDIADLKAAVVGTGFIGVVHVDALRRLGVEVTGVVGSTPERARAKARAAALPEPYPSLEAALEDARVDVVHLTTPNDLHYAQASAALEAGKHVVCEKPLAMTAAETADLVARAERSGLVHAVNFNIRFYPQVQEARARVASGELGGVRLVSGGYLQDWLLFDTDWNWRLDPARGGELRAVGDIGSHWIDLMTFVTGQHVEAVMADMTTFVPVRRRPTGEVETFAGKDGAQGETVEEPMRTEDAAGLLLRFDGGARAVATISQVSAGRKNALSFEVDGAQGAVAWHSERPEELWIGHRERPNELLLRDASLSSPAAAARTTLPAGHAEGFADTFRELYRAVYAAVAAGGPPPEPDYPTFRDGHEEALIGEAIARSAAEGRWITVDRAAPVTQEV